MSCFPAWWLMSRSWYVKKKTEFQPLISDNTGSSSDLYGGYVPAGPSQVVIERANSQTCMYIQGIPVQTQTPTRRNLIGRSMTAPPPPVLSPSRVLPPPSSACAYLPARKSSARVAVMSLHIYFFVKRLSLELHNLKLLKLGKCSYVKLVCPTLIFDKAEFIVWRLNYCIYCVKIGCFTENRLSSL